MSESTDRYAVVSRVLERELAQPYVIGTEDCFFSGLRVIDALSGTDLAGEYAGTYESLRGAQVALRKRGHRTIGDLLARHLRPCAPAAARLGDVGAVEVEGGHHLAVCLGRRWVAKTEAGARYFEVQDVSSAFRTGEDALA